MRKIWTSGTHIHQEINGESQRVRVAIEHLSSEIPSIGGPHDIWIHSSDYEKLQEQNKILREALEFYAENFTTRGSPFWSLHDLIDESDIEETVMPNLGIKICKGGKRAREALAKVEE